MNGGNEQTSLSIVIVARNDDYGGDFLLRLTCFIRNMLALMEEVTPRYEIVIVEWNPPESRPLLHQVIGWPTERPLRGKVRFVLVPPDLHHSFSNAAKMPMFEYIGKNVGVRRATGDFILVTNPDVLFSRGLARKLTHRALKPGRYYRTARFDVRPPLPAGVSVDDVLSYCRSNIIRVNGYWRSRAWTWGSRVNPLACVRIAASYLKWSIRNRSLVNPYVNAAGDFFLMHRMHWLSLRGYPELKTHSFIDGYLAYMAHYSGCRLRILSGEDVFLFHQEHPRIESKFRPLTDIQLYLTACSEMARRRRSTVFNDEHWGLGGIALAEHEWP